MIYGCICLFVGYALFNNVYSIYYHETNSCGVALRRIVSTKKNWVEDLSEKCDIFFIVAHSIQSMNIKQHIFHIHARLFHSMIVSEDVLCRPDVLYDDLMKLGKHKNSRKILRPPFRIGGKLAIIVNSDTSKLS